MTCMTDTRSEHSSLGIVSFVLSFFPAMLLVVIYWMVLYAISKQPPEADTVAYGFGMFVLVGLTTLSEIAALGLGIAGALQRHRKRLGAKQPLERATGFFKNPRGLLRSLRGTP